MSHVTLRILAAMMLLTGLAAEAGADEPEGAASLVVVELFTSQGCNSCPPADAFLGELAQRPDLIALAFHVDYWNYVGWRDPFSSPEASQRQRGYAQSLRRDTVYTPQMIVDGSYDAIGSDRSDVKRKITEARGGDKLQLVVEPTGAGKWIVTFPKAESDSPATIWLVLYDRQHSTVVKRGENAGATLIEYNIVREFRRVGQWDGAELALPVSAYGTDLIEQGGAIILQTGETGTILGAAVLPDVVDQGS